MVARRIPRDSTTKSDAGRTPASQPVPDYHAHLLTSCRGVWELLQESLPTCWVRSTSANIRCACSRVMALPSFFGTSELQHLDHLCPTGVRRLAGFPGQMSADVLRCPVLANSGSESVVLHQMIGGAQRSEIFGSDLRRGHRNQSDGQMHLIKNAAGRDNEPEPPRMIEIGGLGRGGRFWSHWVTRVPRSFLHLPVASPLPVSSSGIRVGRPCQGKTGRLSIGAI